MIGRIDSIRIVDRTGSGLERPCYIRSGTLSAEALAHAVLAHWAVENRLPWTLDVSFGEDASTLPTDHAPQNQSLLRKMALNIIRANKADTRKASLPLKRKGAALDDDKIINILRIKPLC